MQGGRVFRSASHVMQNFRNYLLQQQHTLSSAARHGSCTRATSGSMYAQNSRASNVGPCNNRKSVGRTSSRQMSWVSRLLTRSRPSEPFPPISDGQDEAARSAILEKVMKGRQATDLMLRCTSTLISRTC